MVHGDNQGLALPPGAASVQVVIAPCGITAKTSDEQGANINIACKKLAQTLRKVGVRAKAELRDGSPPGYKFNDWEERGALFGAKNPIPLSNIGSSISSIPHTIQACNPKPTFQNGSCRSSVFHSERYLGLITIGLDEQSGSVLGPSRGYAAASEYLLQHTNESIFTLTLTLHTIRPSLRSMRQETSNLQHRLQDDLLDPADFDQPGTPQNPTPNRHFSTLLQRVKAI
ncbi:hypothetical protein BKA70DRAFT_1437159 [Coprinopsis sp. MPI-PUGE-AT-0042]|nr:hypothetical protein BKA70DRAFT_1437159 [Coprinopsis sp. MPI-PUGE-AT-0042]